MKKLLFFLFTAMLVISCTQEKLPKQSSNDSTSVPPDVAQAIEKEFPGALPYQKAIDSLLAHVAHLGIKADNILWGQSTCVDDIINTKNKLIHPEIKGPFTFGGLGGLPFTGVTGLNAFAHHVPQNGTALLFVGPHIGYTHDGGWGKIFRHGQTEASSCCGALYSALGKLQKNEITAKAPTEEDYQEQIIEQLALQHRDEILNAPEPIITLTRVIFKEAEQRITNYAHQVHERHFAYAVVVAGVIINTDYQFDDYLWIEHLSIIDIKQNKWIKVL
jgi:hypothetical protein